MLKNIRLPINWKVLTAIVVLLSVVAFCFWWSGRTKSVNAVAQDVSDISAEIHRKYAHKNSYWGLNNASLEDTKVLRHRNNQMVNRFNKPVLIGQGENGETIMPGEKTFDIVFINLSNMECIRAATSIFESPEITGLMQITIVGKESQIFEWGSEQYNLPISQAAAKEFCTDNSKIIWTFE